MRGEERERRGEREESERGEDEGVCYYCVCDTEQQSSWQ